jgi:hypothetical protein
VCLDWSKILLVSLLRRKASVLKSSVSCPRLWICLKSGNILSVFCCMHCRAWKNAWITGSQTYCVRYSTQSPYSPTKLYQAATCIGLYLADYVYSHCACTCSSQCVLYQLVKGGTKDRKATSCCYICQKKPVAALHIPNQPTVDLRLLASQAWQNMLNNYKCLPSSNTAHFAMRN